MQVIANLRNKILKYYCALVIKFMLQSIEIKTLVI